MKVKVILKEDVKGVGKKNQIIEVKEGFANNFLISTKKGVLATAENINKLNVQKDKKQREHNNYVENANKLKELIESKELTLKVKSGSNGKVFGSVGSREIVELLKKEFNIEIDKKKINSSTSRIKEVGHHKVEIRLYDNIKAYLNLKVIGLDNE